MIHWQAILAFGALAVIFDGIWATVARHGGYSYAKGMWVSWLIYTVAGSAAGWHTGKILDGAWTGLGVAAIEATVGWWLSAVIGLDACPTAFPPKKCRKPLPERFLQ
jgi:hypothetical protein